jgi:hypothetical protein
MNELVVANPSSRFRHEILMGSPFRVVCSPNRPDLDSTLRTSIHEVSALNGLAIREDNPGIRPAKKLLAIHT